MGRASALKSAELARAIALAAVLAGLFALFLWWGWRRGAYFGTVFFPGAIAVYALLAVLFAFAPFPGRLRGVPLWAVGALFVLAVWMVVSLLWTPTQASAVFYAQHAFLYASMFAVGVWACLLVSRDVTLAMVPVAVAGMVIAAGTVVTIGGGHNPLEYLHGDATLSFPLGYRNANAAFFLICLWPTLALAADRQRNLFVRALMIGSGTAMVGLAFLCQSRGSLPAAAIAAIVWIACSPQRLRAMALALLCVLPAAIAAPTLLDLFQHGEASAGSIPLLHDAARAIGISSLVALVLAAIWFAWLESSVTVAGSIERRLGWALPALAVVLVAVTAFVVSGRDGGPVEFVEQRVSEFTTGGISDFSGKGTRFGANVGSNRGDFWRVSLDQAQRQPVLGGGAGSFQPTYLRERRSSESPRDPHSVEMLMLGELGLPGLMLFLVFVVASVLAAARSWRRGLAAPLVASAAIAAVVYWAIHASYDWLWNYPVLTASVAYLAGVGAAPALATRGRGVAKKVRLALAATAIVLAVAAVPLYLSERYERRALSEWRNDPAAAYRDLDRSAFFNPFDPAPLLDKGQIASDLGDRELALESFRKAVGREPENYAPHYFLVRELIARNPAAAAGELATARRLNPLQGRLDSLARSLRERRRSENGR